MYASTPEGHRATAMTAAAKTAAGDDGTAADLRAAVARGDGPQAANRAVAGLAPEDRLAMGRYAQTHPARDWPFGHATSRGEQPFELGPGVRVHTTQQAVWPEVVAAKRARGPVPGEVVLLMEPTLSGSRLWVLDGHHALAAAREDGLPVTATVYRSGRSDPVTAPRLGRVGAGPGRTRN